MTLQAFLGYIGDVIGQAVIWMTAIWNFIVANPIIVVLTLGIPLIGLGVGLLKRLFSVN